MGREWNDLLARRLGDSAYYALDEPRPVKLLVSDYEDSPTRPGTKLALVELLALNAETGKFWVCASYTVEIKRRPKQPRYREETRKWPG